MPPIALARVDPEQPAFIVIEVEKIEGDAAVAGRRDLELPAFALPFQSCLSADDRRPATAFHSETPDLPGSRFAVIWPGSARAAFAARLAPPGFRTCLCAQQSRPKIPGQMRITLDELP
jgi:hypothetical protein